MHITGGALSPFAALYILVDGVRIAPPSGGRRPARSPRSATCSTSPTSSCSQGTSLGLAVILQLGVFAVTALGVAYLGARLQEAGVNREALAQQLVVAKLQAEDVLKNIRSGIITIDAQGRILFANSTGGHAPRLRR